jgi:hypothetical protein
VRVQQSARGVGAARAHDPRRSGPRRDLNQPQPWIRTRGAALIRPANATLDDVPRHHPGVTTERGAPASLLNARPASNIHRCIPGNGIPGVGADAQTRRTNIASSRIAASCSSSRALRSAAWPHRWLYGPSTCPELVADDRGAAFTTTPTCRLWRARRAQKASRPRDAFVVRCDEDHWLVSTYKYCRFFSNIPRNIDVSSNGLVRVCEAPDSLPVRADGRFITLAASLPRTRKATLEVFESCKPLSRTAAGGIAFVINARSGGRLSAAPAAKSALILLVAAGQGSFRKVDNGHGAGAGKCSRYPERRPPQRQRAPAPWRHSVDEHHRFGRGVVQDAGLWFAGISSGLTARLDRLRASAGPWIRAAPRP